MLHGLIALAPHPDPSGNHFMTALLIDGRAESAMPCMAPHNPKLTFTVPEATQIQCINAGCDLTGLECDCTDALTSKQIFLKITPAPDLSTPLPDNTSPLPELPGTVTAAGDISYIANLSLPPFGQVLNPSYLNSSSPPQNLLARMEIPFHTITACALAAREDKGESHIQPFSFHKLHVRGALTEASQAIAQVAVAQVDVPDGGGGPQQVILHISDFDGNHDHSIVLDQGDGGYMIELSNDTTVLNRDDACEDGVGRHFGLYYDLAMTPPTMADRLIPHARFTDGLKVENFTPPVCVMLDFDPMDRPVCPIAMFKP
jgi:hypothetical protein